MVGSRQDNAMDKVSVVLAVLLGLFLVVSGAGKLLDVSVFLDTVRAYGVPYRLAYGAALLPPLEILLGVGLLVLFRVQRLALVSSVLFAFFTLAFLYGHFIHGISDCGCFGALSVVEFSPFQVVLRNVVLIAVSVFLWRRPPLPWVWHEHVAVSGVVAGVGALLFTAAGISSVQPIYQSQVDGEDPDWRGKDVMETPLAPFMEAHEDSTYLVFVYSTTCAHCWDAMENVKAYQRSGIVDRVVGLTTSDDSTLADFERRFETNFETRLIEPEAMSKITSAVPRAYLVEDGRVFFSWRGGVWSPHTFEARRPLLESASR